MGFIILMTIFIPLATVGMVLVIIWSMSAAGSGRNEYAQEKSEHIHSRDVGPENLFLIDGADGEPATRKSDCIGGNPCGDRSINHGICTLTQLVSDLVLKELARLNGRGTNIP